MNCNKSCYNSIFINKISQSKPQRAMYMAYFMSSESHLFPPLLLVMLSLWNSMLYFPSPTWVGCQAFMAVFATIRGFSADGAILGRTTKVLPEQVYAYPGKYFWLEIIWNIWYFHSKIWTHPYTCWFFICCLQYCIRIRDRSTCNCILLLQFDKLSGPAFLWCVFCYSSFLCRKS